MKVSSFLGNLNPVGTPRSEVAMGVVFVCSGQSSFGFCYRLLADKVGGVVAIAAALIHGLAWIGA